VCGPKRQVAGWPSAVPGNRPEDERDHKAIFLQQIAKIEFEPAGEGYTVTSADFDRVCEAAERARVVAQIGLDGYQDGMRRIAQQNH
jgi:hypothetical protein